ncbi:sigma-70 family RNA polymerase sigma factor [Lentilactobacillus parafarraginis]|jgi:RNA polymerase sporulation-specific sigma factor|uniref:Sigma-70 region 2 n=3 Tax=Lentilactobacillus parafarraginis TaxID=390842 RepID=A0A0R1Z297_9LACO|nr:sigma-70 family RNA polymerase sigma factor [Lentilactobacillus parafarraginis]EHL99556.1 Sigma-70 region 2 [Lentilactobacillus parafarraginis F0439]KRM45196.1 Sigma-70 region 2 [Lentilactobacillus parafarraginis DSM 18390 = JCM 14109]TLQ19548.1 sigma-70 family RNA polymerase sigma factor [Lentilactobacillus parafarraginis]
MTTKAEFKMIRMAADGDEQAFKKLFEQYHPLVRKFNKMFYVYGMDRDDFDQEASIVLLKAAQHYDYQRSITFGTFFRASLKNRFFDLVRKNKAQKRQPRQLPKYIDENLGYYAATLKDSAANSPEFAMLLKESFRDLYLKCSPLEQDVFAELLAQGSAGLIDQKSFLNAYERCKRKFDNESN